MSLPEKDFAERSRSIFEQLRAQTEVEADAPPADVAAPPSADVDDDLGSEVGGAEPPPVDSDGGPGLDDSAEAFGEASWESEVTVEPDDERTDVGPDDVAGSDEADQADVPESSPTEDLQGTAEDLAGDPTPSPAWTDQPTASLATVTESAIADAMADVPVPDADDLPTTTDAPLPDPQRFVRPLPRVLAIANQKGGVGKTTTTVNLGASLAVLGYRVLVIDLDPQGNATTGLGINSRNLETSIYDVILHDTPLDDCVEPTTLRNLFVAPATIDLAGAEIELVPAFSREQRLKRALAEVKDDYEFVLIDCPPSLGLLTVNALSAASEVVVPIQCEYYALEGLGQLLRNINLVQSNLNPTLELSAIILTMYDARTKLAEQVADEVRQHFGDRVCRNVVPRTVRLSEAPSFGQPIIVFDPSSRGALAYRELATEVSGGPPQRTG